MPDIERPPYKAWDSFIVDLYSDTLRIQYEYNQSVGVAEEVNNKRAPGLIRTRLLNFN